MIFVIFQGFTFNDAPRPLQDALRPLQDAPRALQDAPRALQDAPRALQDAPTGAKRGQEALPSDLGAILDRFWTSRDFKNLEKPMTNNDFQGFRYFLKGPFSERPNALSGG